MDKEDAVEFNETEAPEVARLEAQLRQALRHVPAPAGFADRVMARVEAKQNTKRPGTLHAMRKTATRPAAWWSAIAAAAIVSTGALTVHMRQVRQERVAAEEAQAKMELAVKLTTHALSEVQDGMSHNTAGKFALLLTAEEGR